MKTFWVVFAMLMVEAISYDEFKQKVVLVTGGTSGIGYETALEFARNGARVVIASRDSHPSWYNGSSTVSSISNDAQVRSANGSVRFVKTDISNQTSVKALFADIVSNEKTLDIAINNAGISGPSGNLNEIEQYLHTEYDPISNNLYGTIHCLLEEIKHFVNAKKDGVIVNIASIDGLAAHASFSLYSASKFGIASLTRSLGVEFLTSTPKIRVNAVAPGGTNTSLLWQQVKIFNQQQSWEGSYVNSNSDLWKRWGSQISDGIRCKRLAEPSEEAAVVLFLSSNAASYISGSVYTVDNAALA